MEHKYLRHSVAGFFIWPVADGRFWHKHLMEALNKKYPDGYAVSAGILEFKNGNPHCFGRSDTLDLPSNLEDSALLKKQLGLGAKK